MKAGTAQKLVLNMLSTATMVRLGRVLSNSMVNLQLTNQKLWKRAARILKTFTGMTDAQAAQALKDAGRSLPVAMLMALKKISREKAMHQLQRGASVAKVLRQAMNE
jgi:N-acetylmuramic acid 6-phosphate etherase